MTDNENFDDKLAGWTLEELRIEVTRGDTWSPKKLARIQARIAELENAGTGNGKGREDGSSGGMNKTLLIGVIAVVVVAVILFLV